MKREKNNNRLIYSNIHKKIKWDGSIFIIILLMSNSLKLFPNCRYCFSDHVTTELAAGRDPD